MTLTGTAALAKKLGCSKPAVTRRAKSLGLGTIVGQSLVLTPAECERLRAVIRPGQPGNPNFGTPAATKAAMAGRKKAAARRKHA